MIRRFACCCLAAVALCAVARGQNSAVDLANLREDVNGLNQRIGELALRIEQLEARVGQAPAPRMPKDVVTAGQLNEAIAGLAAQVEELRKAAAAPAARPRETPAHATAPEGAAASFPHEGVAYVVQKGDTLALIAKKSGAKVQDIVNANQLADPSHIQVGQKLFLPGGR